MTTTVKTCFFRLLCPLIVMALLATSQALAAQRPKITFNFSNWVPFTSLDEEGRAKGLYVDIIREIFINQLGADVECKQVPWRRAQYNIENGLADIIITVPTKKRLKYAMLSKRPLVDLELRIYTYSDHPLFDAIGTISTAGDIKKLGLVPVTNIGNSWHKLNIDSVGIATQYVSDEEAAFRLLATRRADITIEPIHAGSYLIAKLGLKNQVKVTPASFGPLKMHLLFSRKSPYVNLMPRLDAAIEHLTRNGFLEGISNKYIHR